MNQKTGMIHALNQPLAARKPSAGPDGPPRNSVTAIADIVMTFMNSARKKIANRMPVYSVLNPPTSSCSASTRSNGGWFVSATAAIRKMTNATIAGSQYQSPLKIDSMPSQRLLVDDAARRERVRLDEHADDREPERGFVAEAAAPTRAPSRAAGTSSPTTSPRASRRRRRGPTSRGATAIADREVGELQEGLVPGDRHDAADRARSQNARNAGSDRQVRREAEDAPVGGVGHRLLLEEQLDAVGERLQHAERARRGRGRCGSACRR